VIELLKPRKILIIQKKKNDFKDYPKIIETSLPDTESAIYYILDTYAFSDTN
jgi:hypothetical protein